MDLSIGEHSRTLPGLRVSNPYNTLWSSGQDHMSSHARVPPARDRPPSLLPPVQQEACSSSPDLPDTFAPCQGNITIPRPHGRKTPELGKVLAPPVTQSSCKVAEADGRTKSGGHEFRQALSMNTAEDLLKPTEDPEDSRDLLSLLDPLNSSVKTSPMSRVEGGDSGVPSKSYTGLTSFPLHPHASLNPFAQSLHHTSPHMHYSPTVSGNPFSMTYGPPAGSYFHPPPHVHSFSRLQGLYRNRSPGTSPLPPSFGLSAFPSSTSPLPHSCASSHALSNLVDSVSVPNSTPNISAKPPAAERDCQKAQDLFGDLLTMVKPATPQKKKAEDPRRRWETFD